VKILKQRNAALMGFLRAERGSSALIGATDQFLSDEQAKFRLEELEKIHVESTEESASLLTALNPHLLDNASDDAGTLLEKSKAATSRLAKITAQLESVPTADAVGKIIESRSQISTAIGNLKRDIERLEIEASKKANDLERQQRSLVKLFDKVAHEKIGVDDAGRIIQFSKRSRSSLEEFRIRVIERNLSKIEEFVLESFRDLLHKSNLVSRVTIDPTSFKVQLFDQGGAIFGVEHLSAGEKQLFSIAILWGLAKASGRPLPIIVDTPLGRLDADHRKNLMELYFPAASHQMLLLSTDTEIGPDEQSALTHHIGHRYLLEFDTKESRTTVRKGYFRAGEATHEI